MIGKTFAGIALAALLGVASAQAETAAPKPKLVVAIAVDQFSSGLFEQYRNHFQYGFKRFLDGGAVFPSGYQSHAATETCPGHSTILTGRHPSATGIIANNWSDANAGTDLYCVEDPTYVVPGRPKGPRGPSNLKVSTLGEWMRSADPSARTVAVSGKDRAAIMMSGHQPTAVYWWDDELGFNTYVPQGASADARLSPVKAFNAALDKAWAKAPPQWRLIDASCASMFGKETYGALALDHVVPPPYQRASSEGPLRNDPAFKAWFRASPELDKVTLDLAADLVGQLKLGQRASTDLLAVSLSATDYVGHRYGNQGPEMCDQLAHLDKALGDFFAKLDKLHVPYAIALTADHGGLDAVERVAERGVDGRRIAGDPVSEVNAALKTQFGLDYNPIFGGEGLYVDRRQTSAAVRAKILDAAKAMLEARPDVAAVFTKDEALATHVAKGKPADELTLLERFSESVDADRSPDLLVAFKPYYSGGAPKKPGDYLAGHGSPWNYDRRVPILFWRSGGSAFEQYLPIETVDIAPTLAALVGVQAPETDGVCRDLDKGPASTCEK